MVRVITQVCLPLTPIHAFYITIRYEEGLSCCESLWLSLGRPDDSVLEAGVISAFPLLSCSSPLTGLPHSECMEEFVAITMAREILAFF